MVDYLADFSFCFFFLLKYAFALPFEHFLRRVSFRITIDPVILSTKTFISWRHQNQNQNPPKSLSSVNSLRTAAPGRPAIWNEPQRLGPDLLWMQNRPADSLLIAVYVLRCLRCCGESRSGQDSAHLLGAVSAGSRRPTHNQKARRRWRHASELAGQGERVPY